MKLFACGGEEHAYGGDAGTRALSLSHTCGHLIVPWWYSSLLKVVEAKPLAFFGPTALCRGAAVRPATRSSRAQQIPGTMSTFACIFGSPQAQEELRKLYPSPVRAAAGGPKHGGAPSAAYVDDAPFENGHAPLAEAFAAHKVCMLTCHGVVNLAWFNLA